MTIKKKSKQKTDLPAHAGQEGEFFEDDVVFDSEEPSNVKEKKLREKLNACLKEKQEYLEGWQRTKADFVNARKEEEEKRKGLKDFANEGLLQDLIPVLNSFDMAFANKDAWEEVDETWRKGIEYIHSQFHTVLDSYGVTVISPEGEKFNPEIHNALEIIETDDEAQDDMIESVLQNGYKLKDRVIRPANVKVFHFKK